MSDDRPERSLYYYSPNKGAPISLAIFFAISGGFHVWQCISYKSFKITALLPICCALLSAGFAVRDYSAFYPDHVTTYIASNFLIYITPPLLELANFHILGRILYFVPYLTPLNPGRVLTTFGFLSLIVEILNALGVSYSLNVNRSSSVMRTGQVLLQASLIMQICVMALFVSLAATFHHRCIRHGIRNSKLTVPLITLYVSNAIITIRTIYRLVEHFGAEKLYFEPGMDPDSISPVIKHEWYFWAFEAAPMLTCVVLFNYFHPGRFLPQDNKIYLAKDGVTEVQGPGYKEDRPWVLTFFDPFDFIGIATRRGMKDKQFWEDSLLVSSRLHGQQKPMTADQVELDRG